MSYEVYRFLHLSLVIVFFLLAATSFFAPRNAGKMLPITVAISAILLLVTGMGLVAKLKIGFPPWVIGKLLLWLLIIFLIPFIKKRFHNAEMIGITTLITIGVLIVYLVSFRPFS